MTIYIWCELICDTCSTTAPGRFAIDRLPKRDMIADARKHGWIITRDNVFCGKYCQSQGPFE